MNIFKRIKITIEFEKYTSADDLLFEEFFQIMFLFLSDIPNEISEDYIILF